MRREIEENMNDFYIYVYTYIRALFQLFTKICGMNKQSDTYSSAQLTALGIHVIYMRSLTTPAN
jgi:hypothetical protein